MLTNWFRIYGLRHGILQIEVPPSLPMPGNPSLNLETGNIREKTASLNEQVFRACCELWVAANGIYRQCRLHESNNSASEGFISTAFRQLLDWVDALPLRLVRSDVSTHPVLMMQ